LIAVVTVLGGLPAQLSTAAVGMAFDIADHGKAEMTPARNAFATGQNMARGLRATIGLAQGETALHVGRLGKLIRFHTENMLKPGNLNLR
jgi:hypothetical protein